MYHGTTTKPTNLDLRFFSSTGFIVVGFFAWQGHSSGEMEGRERSTLGSQLLRYPSESMISWGLSEAPFVPRTYLIQKLESNVDYSFPDSSLWAPIWCHRNYWVLRRLEL